MSEPVIHTHHLRKRYGDLEAVRGVDLTVARGEVFCLLGPNGAGKTSVVEILEGYRAASGGEATVLGIPVGRAGAWTTRSSAIPSSSSSTSRPPASIPPPGVTPGRRSARCASSARRSCSPPTSWTRPSTSPTASR